MKKLNMTRDEMIEILIEDRMWDWVYARNYDGLKEMLIVGSKGFDNYTNEELKEQICWIEDKIDDIKELLKRKEGDDHEKMPF